MATLTAAFRDEVIRLAKRATKHQFSELQKRSTAQRRTIAVLRREMADLRRQMASKGSRQPKAEAPPDDGKQLRFQVRGLVSDRKRLGLSAGDYGRLVGVSGQTIYHWEQEKSTPRRAQLVALAAVRGIGKKEATRRLDDLKQ